MFTADVAKVITIIHPNAHKAITPITQLINVIWTKYSSLLYKLTAVTWRKHQSTNDEYGPQKRHKLSCS